jgi:hypothetical protein
MSQAERAYKILQQLTGEKQPPSGEGFDSWSLRVIELLVKELNKVKLEIAKLKKGTK